MSSVMPSFITSKNAEQAFYESQKMSSDKRGMTFEALFYRQLHQVTARIHDTENIAQIMLETSQDICKLLNADRLTLYAVTEDGTAIVSKVKTGLNTSRDLKLPISPQSIAGYVAVSKRPLNLPDVYDDAALKKIHPSLTFLKEVDKRSGYRTRQMLVAPILEGATLHGVLQVINNKSDEPFGELEIDGVAELCKTLATAIRQRALDGAPRKKATKYDGLVADGILTEAELNQCVQDARNEDQSIEHLFMANFKIKPAQIGPALAKFFGVVYEPFSPSRVRSEGLHGALKKEFVLTQGWIPLEESPEGLVIMCLDPEAVRGARVVPQVFPRISRFAYHVTTKVEFEETLAQLFGATADGTSIDDFLAGMDGGPIEDGTNDDSLESAAADNELVKFVNKVIIDAYHQKVSDIHIEPMPGKFKTGIRFRIDGSLVPYVEVPAHFRQAMVTRLKIMCDLDISERRKPQDGKIKFKKYGPIDIELRVATIPSAGGVEDVVMRILAAGEPIPLEKLGLTPHNKERVIKTIEKPYGLFYVCGPTGSGKTTTLYAGLSTVDAATTNVLTVEDPVEYELAGIGQTQVNSKIDLTFAKALRAILRQDPDVIMIGEIRDFETAQIAVQASLTGHLVLATLHTNDAPSAVTRLTDMGIEPFLLSSSLLGVLAQRLVRKLCPECKRQDAGGKWHPVGCKACGMSGYKGRTGV